MLSDFALDLVREQVTVLVVGSDVASLFAAKQATEPIPIIFVCTAVI